MFVNEVYYYAFKVLFKKQAIVSHSNYTLKEEPGMNVCGSNVYLKELYE